MNTLELRHIRKSFDGQGVLEDISLSVPAGSVTAIIGPSGSGKSTLLRCATLLETADGGDIIYEGKYAAKDGVYAPKAELHAIRRYFGLVFQSYNLFPHFTLLKNVMDAPVQVQKRPAAEVREEAMALLGKMGLADRADAYPCQLSGGQQQRAAIARALCMKPELLFDVPPEKFLPAPKVTSAVIRCVRRERPAVDVADEGFFFKVMRGGFLLRRKTLANSLSAALPGIPKESIQQAITDMGLPAAVRGEQLTLEDFAALSAALGREADGD